MQIPGENPWLLLLSTAMVPDQRELPLGIYALETRMVDGAAQAAFVKCVVCARPLHDAPSPFTSAATAGIVVG